MLRAFTFIWRKIAWFYWYSPISMGVKHNPKEVYWLYINIFIVVFLLLILYIPPFVADKEFVSSNKPIWLAIGLLVLLLVGLSMTLAMLYGFYNRHRITPSDVKPMNFRYMTYLNAPAIYFLFFRRRKK